MDMQLSVTSNSSALLLSVGIGLIVISLAYLRLLVVVEKTRRTFRVLQPDVQITRSETIYSNGEDILTIYLRNVGGSQASDIRVTVHGGEGLEPLPIIPVMNQGDSECEVWVKAKSGSPLLQEKRDYIRLMIRYRDQWGYSYALTYPVVQRETRYGGWVALHLVERGKPRVSKPSVSFLRMRKYLRCHSQKMRKGNVNEEALGGRIDLSHDELLSRSLVHSYLGRVWQTQNKRGNTTTKIKYNPQASRFTAN